MVAAMQLFFINIGTWFIKIITSELIQLIIQNLILLFLTYSKDMVPIVMAEIRRVSFDLTLTSEQKFQSVFNSVKSQFPDIATSTINAIIESCYSYFKSNK